MAGRFPYVVDAGEAPLQWDDSTRVALPEDLFPGEAVSLRIPVRAPASSRSRARLIVSAVLDGSPGRWAEEASFTSVVNVL